MKTVHLAFALAVGVTQAETNFFTVEERDGKWSLIDPQGKPFYMRGLNHYGDGTHMPWNRLDSHGDATAWRRALPDRLRSWGFNYLPPSIGPSAIDPRTLTPEQKVKRGNPFVTRTPDWPAEHFAELDFPFTLFLEYPKQYMAGPGMPDVFSEDFRKAVDERCKAVCLPLKDNKNLIGYHFCHNPPWHPRAHSFDRWVRDATKPGSAGRKVWVGLMRRIYGTVERWRQTYGIPVKTWAEIASLDQPLRGYIDHARMLADKEAFMQIDGNDIIFVSRTAWENERGQAQRWHDANMLTIHRIRDFRS